MGSVQVARYAIVIWYVDELRGHYLGEEYGAQVRELGELIDDARWYWVPLANALRLGPARCHLPSSHRVAEIPALGAPVRETRARSGAQDHRVSLRPRVLQRHTRGDPADHSGAIRSSPTPSYLHYGRFMRRWRRCGSWRRSSPPRSATGCGRGLPVRMHSRSGRRCCRTRSPRCSKSIGIGHGGPNSLTPAGRNCSAQGPAKRSPWRGLPLIRPLIPRREKRLSGSRQTTQHTTQNRSSQSDRFVLSKAGGAATARAKREKEQRPDDEEFKKVWDELLSKGMPDRDTTGHPGSAGLRCVHALSVVGSKNSGKNNAASARAPCRDPRSRFELFVRTRILENGLPRRLLHDPRVLQYARHRPKQIL